MIRDATVMTRRVQVFAPAKINLALHVIGQREDGYHLLDSLVCFAGIGDTLTVTEGEKGGLSLSGPFAEALRDTEDNLIGRVARFFAPNKPLAFHLEKELPVASGIGGGSADAAACYRALQCLGTGPGDAAADLEMLLGLGADIPVCIDSAPAFLRGIGETVSPIPGLPPLHAVLVNPGLPVATPSVFKALSSKTNAPLDPLPEDLDTGGFLHWLRAQRNDLEVPARSLLPVIGDVLHALSGSEGCVLARMSGSGATCFGLFETADAATLAARRVSRSNPGWWVRATDLDGGSRAAPQVSRSTT
jgi:4-diphosphocytidyl-2-C-methyl-D-erythritol kinase